MPVLRVSMTNIHAGGVEGGVSWSRRFGVFLSSVSFVARERVSSRRGEADCDRSAAAKMLITQRLCAAKGPKCDVWMNLPLAVSSSLRPLSSRSSRSH